MPAARRPAGNYRPRDTPSGLQRARCAKVTVLEALKCSEGVVSVQRLRVHSLGPTEEYLRAAATSPMHVLDADTTEKLLALPGRAVALPCADAFGAAMPPLPPS